MAGDRTGVAKPLLRFMVVGAALVATDRIVGSDSEPPVVRLHLPTGASAAEIRTRAAEEVLVEAGIAAGWADDDRLIVDRLRRNQAFLGDIRLAPDDAARHDPIVRRRLVDRGRRLLMAARAREPDERTLKSWLDAHATRFTWPARVVLEHRFFSRDSRGDRATREALSALHALRTTGGLDVRGDPFHLAPGRLSGDPASLDRRLGAGFGQAVARLPAGVWSGPVASAYGAHLVRVVEKAPATVPPLAAIRGVVRSDWLNANHARLQAEAYDALLADRRIVLMEGGG